jgi:hypothetical protein
LNVFLCPTFFLCIPTLKVSLGVFFENCPPAPSWNNRRSPENWTLSVRQFDFSRGFVWSEPRRVVIAVYIGPPVTRKVGGHLQGKGTFKEIVAGIEPGGTKIAPVRDNVKHGFFDQK